MKQVALQKTEEKTDKALPVLQRQEEPEDLEQENASIVGTPLYLQASLSGTGNTDNPDQDDQGESATLPDIQKMADVQQVPETHDSINQLI